MKNIEYSLQFERKFNLLWAQKATTSITPRLTFKEKEAPRFLGKPEEQANIKSVTISVKTSQASFETVKYFVSKVKRQKSKLNNAYQKHTPGKRLPNLTEVPLLQLLN